MAYFFRFLRVALVSVFLLPALSFAALPQVTQYQGQKFAGSLPWSASKLQACADVVSYLTSQSSDRTYAVTGYDPTCTWSMNGSPWDASSYNTRLSCPAFSTESGGQCVCDAAHAEVNGACVAKNDDRDQCAAWGAIGGTSGGALVQDYRLQGNVSDGAQYCMQGAFDSPSKGCKVSFSRETFLDYGAGNSVTEGTFSIASNASTVDQSCAVGDQNTPPKVPPPEKCKDGYTGMVNGVETCVKKVPDSGVGNNDKEETTDTEEETKKVKTESKTECKNGNCTTTNTVTTTTTKKPGGATTTTSSTTTTTQGQGSFCKENPGTKMCSTGEEAGIGDVGGVTGGKQHGQPELYESSYPNGIKGVWEASGIAGADGKFGQLVGALLPGIADTNGACLSFQVPMNVGIVDFGILDISPPCIIWPFIRICILITALWLARSLIFGG